MVRLPRRTLVAASVSLVVAGCGGGGGGGGGGLSSTLSPYLRSSVPYHTPVLAGTFQPHTVSGNAAAVTDIFARDLNNDAVDEVVIGGRMTSQSNVANHGSTNLQIYGWNTGSFASETATWFAGNDNQILGTEPSIKFGDFNGDGRVDMFAAPSTDMTLYGPGAAFINQGGSFTRVDVNLGNVWAHDSVVDDLNGDGFADILVPDYNMRPAVAFGSAAGTFTVVTASTNQTGASGISVADYLGDGTRTLIMTDAGGTAGSNTDTHLFTWSTASGSLVLTQIAALPESRFYLPKWNAVRTAAGIAPHEIRNMTMDFNSDGRPDVIVFSTMPQGTNAHGYTEVQFLRNDGSGVFVDVTDSVLRDFDTNKSVTYQPQLIDVNNDGLLDIFMSGTDYSGQASTTVLINTQEGIFVERYASTFSDFSSQIRGMVGSPYDGTQAINIIRGPNSINYLVSTVQFSNNGTTNTSVYLAEIGSFGTVTAQASIATLQSAWPWMSAVTANESLARTALQNFSGYDPAVHGNGIIDLWAAINPIGGLGISLDGRTGSRKPITGGISLPGFDRDLLGKVTAVDALTRNFDVDLRGMSSESVPTINARSSEIQDPAQSWSSRYISHDFNHNQGFHALGDSLNWTTGVSTRAFGWNSPWTAQISLTQMQGSPWMHFSGIFGTIKSSTMIDASMTRRYQNGAWHQWGAMQTTTDFDAGLVTAVRPIYSAYAVAGWQDEQWSVYGGLQPTVLAGSVNLTLPGSVDNQGVLHYSNHRVNLKGQPVTFVGGERRFQSGNHSWRAGAVINDRGTYQAKISYSMGF